MRGACFPFGPMTPKEARLRLPIGLLRQVLQEELGTSKVDRAGATLDLEKLALENFTRCELETKVADLRRRRSNAKANVNPDAMNERTGFSTQGQIGEPSSLPLMPDSDELSGSREMTYGSENICQNEPPFSHRDFDLRESINQVNSSKQAGKVSDIWRGSHGGYCSRYAQQPEYVSTTSSSYENDRRGSLPDNSVFARTRSMNTQDHCQYSTNRRDSHLPTQPNIHANVERRSQRPHTACVGSVFASSPREMPPTPSQDRGSLSAHNVTTAERWFEPTPVNERPIAETPLLRTRTTGTIPNYGPSHFHTRGTGRSNQRQHITQEPGKVMPSVYKNSVSRISEGRHEALSEVGSATGARFKTPMSHRFSLMETLASKIYKTSRRSASPHISPDLIGRSSCRPSDAVPYNPNPYKAAANAARRRAGTRCCSVGWWLLKYKWSIAASIFLIWIIGLPNPGALIGLGGFSSLLPSSKSTANLPTFCSVKRNTGQPCTPCPRRALCFEGKAECPTYYALESVSPSEWECKSYKDELERIAEEGFQRVVAYLRKIEKPVDCERLGRPPLSAVDSRRDVLDLFDQILLPMLDERQKGLKDGLLQMYLTLLASDERLAAAHLEKEGSLHVSLASIVTRNRFSCYLPGQRVMMGVGGVALGVAVVSWFS